MFTRLNRQHLLIFIDLNHVKIYISTSAHAAANNPIFVQNCTSPWSDAGNHACFFHFPFPSSNFYFFFFLSHSHSVLPVQPLNNHSSFHCFSSFPHFLAHFLEGTSVAWTAIGHNSNFSTGFIPRIITSRSHWTQTLYNIPSHKQLHAHAHTHQHWTL